MIKKTKYDLKLILIMLLSVLVLEGCKIFKKKKGCADCPKWSKNKIENAKDKI